MQRKHRQNRQKKVRNKSRQPEAQLQETAGNGNKDVGFANDCSVESQPPVMNVGNDNTIESSATNKHVTNNCGQIPPGKLNESQSAVETSCGRSPQFNAMENNDVGSPKCSPALQQIHHPDFPSTFRTKQELKDKKKENMRRKRASMNEDDKIVYRSKDAERKRNKRAMDAAKRIAETTTQCDHQRVVNSDLKDNKNEGMRRKRLSMNEEEKKTDRDKTAERKRNKLSSLTEEGKITCREKDAERKRKNRATLAEKDKQKREIKIKIDNTEDQIRRNKFLNNDAEAHRKRRLVPEGRKQLKVNETSYKDNLDPVKRKKMRDADARWHRLRRKLAKQKQQIQVNKKFYAEKLESSSKKRLNRYIVNCRHREQPKYNALTAIFKKALTARYKNQFKYRIFEKKAKALAQRKKYLDILLKGENRKIKNSPMFCLRQQVLTKVKNNLKKRLTLFKNKIMRQNVRSSTIRKVLENEKAQKRRTKLEQTKSESLEQFRKAIKEGPDSVCCVCGGLFFTKSVTQFPKLKSTKGLEKLALEKAEGWNTFLQSIKLLKSPNLICSTCKSSVKKRKTPKLAIVNGFKFPPIPEVLRDLAAAEERLVAGRLPFMKVYAVGPGAQSKLFGNVVNVWHPVNQTVEMLPRNFSESGTIQVALMRRFEYKRPYMFESIRPRKVFEAAKYLLQTEAYKKDGFILSDEWSNYPDGDTVEFKTGESNADDQILEKFPNDSESDDDIEEIDLNTQGTIETMVHSANPFQGIKIAPCQNQVPLTFHRDELAEILAFPTIYCGITRKFSLPVTYADIAKSEARRHDRRACSPMHILYSYKLLQTIKIVNSIQISLKKRKVGKVTAKQMMDQDFVKKLLVHDDGYNFLKCVRSSPAYWQNEKRRLMATIRQKKRLPTFFLTLSAAETQWKELIVILAKVLENKVITEIEAEALTWEEKASLIRKDPVTTSRYFDHKFREFVKHILMSPGLFESYSVDDIYFRVEFQNRGSPHVHGMVWINEAPMFDKSDLTSYRTCEEFVDKFITCHNDPVLARLQSHRHGSSCRRRKANGKTYCRFNMPMFPMTKTTILVPNRKSRTSKENLADRENVEKLKELLTKYRKENRQGILFEEFLNAAKLNELEYLNAVRSTITGPTVFLQRDVDSAFINAYSKDIVKAWQANMDLQFIIDPYACARYIAAYVCKNDRRLSQLLRAVAKEVDAGNHNARNKLWSIGARFLNSTEISAQEAAYGVLGLPMVVSTRTCIYIQTAHPDYRVFLVKDEKELETLSDNETQIILPGLLDHYINRPRVLDDISLAYFAAYYEFTHKQPTIKDTKRDENPDEILEISYGSWIPQLSNNGYVRKRGKAKIIRYRRYSKIDDYYNYCREQVMLYLPFRNEETDIIKHKEGVERLYEIKQDLINQVREEFDPNAAADIFDAAQAAADAEIAEIEDENEQKNLTMEQSLYYHSNTDVDLSESNKESPNICEQFHMPTMMEDQHYYQQVSQLNKKQLQYFTHFLRNINNCPEGVCEVICGGAGTGKTRLIHLMTQAVCRKYLATAGSESNLCPILRVAPTGRAAWLIRGTTIHTAFSLGINRGFEIKPLSPMQQNSMYSKLRNLEVIIIDEGSMVCNAILYSIDHRLRQIFCTPDAPFGNKYIVMFADFHQLPPVHGRLIFQPIQLAGPVLWSRFRFFELTEIMRQREDAVLAHALNNLAIGNLTPDQIDLFMSRIVSPALEPPAEAIRLFPWNKHVKSYNSERLASMNTEGSVAISTDIVHGARDEEEEERILASARNKGFRETFGLTEKIDLRVGANFMITSNICISDGLVNGTNGILESILYSDKEKQIPRILLIVFPEVEIGIEARNAYNGTCPNNSTPIFPIRKTIYNTKDGKLFVTRQQFPIVCSESLTIHKSQGGTYAQGTAVKLYKTTRQMKYVALSRVQSLDKLFILDEFIPPSRPSIHDPVELEIQRLRNESPINFSILDLEKPSGTLKLYFHNIQSLTKYFPLIKTNHITMDSDVIMLVETWTLPEDMLELPGFKILHRNNNSSQRTPFGNILYVKSIHEASEAKIWKRQCGKHHAELVSFSMHENLIIFGYKSPMFPILSFYGLLEECLTAAPRNRITIFGDFNLDLKKNKSLITFLSRFDLNLSVCISESSTRYDTLIDVVFSQVPSIQAGFLHVVMSHHSPIVAFIPISLAQNDSPSPLQQSLPTNTLSKAAQEADVTNALYASSVGCPRTPHIGTLGSTNTCPRNPSPKNTSRKTRPRNNSKASNKRKRSKSHNSSPNCSSRKSVSKSASKRLDNNIVSFAASPIQEKAETSSVSHNEGIPWQKYSELYFPNGMSISTIQSLQGSVHQADQIFGESGGFQCTCIAAAFLCVFQATNPSVWGSEMIDTILHYGTEKYNSLPQNKIGVDGFVSADNVMGDFILRDCKKSVSLAEGNTFYAIYDIAQANDDDYVNIKTMIEDAIEKIECGILICSNFSLGFFVRGSCVFLFNSHSTDRTGLQVSQGKATLIKLLRSDGPSIISYIINTNYAPTRIGPVTPKNKYNFLIGLYEVKCLITEL